MQEPTTGVVDWLQLSVSFATLGKLSRALVSHVGQTCAFHGASPAQLTSAFGTTPQKRHLLHCLGLHSIPQWQIADQSEEGQQHETDVIYDVVVVAAIFG